MLKSYFQGLQLCFKNSLIKIFIPELWACKVWWVGVKAFLHLVIYVQVGYNIYLLVNASTKHSEWWYEIISKRSHSSRSFQQYQELVPISLKQLI
jgi:hypothetical protein